MAHVASSLGTLDSWTRDPARFQKQRVRYALAFRCARLGRTVSVPGAPGGGRRFARAPLLLLLRLAPGLVLLEEARVGHALEALVVDRDRLVPLLLVAEGLGPPEPGGDGVVLQVPALGES